MPSRPPISELTDVITGATSGFGRGSAIKIASLGAKVVIAARRTDILNEVVDEITEAGGFAIAVTCDVAEPRDVEHLRDVALKVSGKIDVWVNKVLDLAHAEPDRVSVGSFDRPQRAVPAGPIGAGRLWNRHLAQLKMPRLLPMRTPT